MGQKQTSLASWKFSRRACQSLNIWLWQFEPWFALIDFPPLEWGAVMGLNLATITRAPQCYCFSIILLLSCTCTCVHAVRACVRPSSHEVIKVPLIKPCPQINHLHAQVCSCKLNPCAHTHTHAHTKLGMQIWSLSIRHAHKRMQSFALIAMHTSPASNTSDLTFPSELCCSWHGIFPHVGFAASEVRTNFTCFTHSKLVSPCSLSHYWLPPLDCLGSISTP